MRVSVLELGEEQDETWQPEQSGDAELEDRAEMKTPFEMDLKDTK